MLSNPNVKIQGAFGDIYTPTTAYTDKLIGRLDAEAAANRKADRDAQDAANKALDDNYAKSIVGVKEADIPELTQAYSDYKTAAKNVIAKKDRASIEEQQDVLRKQAAYMQKAAGSVDQKNEEKANYISANKNANAHTYDAIQKLAEINKIPTSQLADYYKNNAYTDEKGNTVIPTSVTDLVQFKGSTKSLQPLVDKAIKNTVPTYETIVDPNNPTISKQVKVQSLKSPSAAFQSLYTDIIGSGSKGVHDAGVLFTPDAATKMVINQKYQDLVNTPGMAKRMGNGNPNAVILPDDSQLDATGIAAKYRIMQEHINQQPIVTELPKETQTIAGKNADVEAAKTIAFGRQKELLGIRQAFTEKVNAAKELAKKGQLEGNDNNLLPIIADLEQTKKPTNDPNESEYVINPNIDPKGADAIYKNEKTGKVRLVTYQRELDSKTGTYKVVNNDKGVPSVQKDIPMTMENFIIMQGGSKRLANILGGKKEAAAKIAQAVNTVTKPVGTQAAPTEIKIKVQGANGKIYHVPKSDLEGVLKANKGSKIVN
jgi:hypothetical protein